MPLGLPTNSELELYPIVCDLVEASRDPKRRIRLLGVGLSNLGLYDEQIGLFQTGERLHQTVDAIRQRFGFDSIRIAAGSNASRQVRPRHEGDG